MKILYLVLLVPWLKNINFVGGNTIMMHSDNYTTSDLNGLINAHETKSKNCLLTMLTF